MLLPYHVPVYTTKPIILTGTVRLCGPAGPHRFINEVQRWGWANGLGNLLGEAGRLRSVMEDSSLGK